MAGMIAEYGHSAAISAALMSVAIIRHNCPADCLFCAPENESWAETLASYKDEEKPMSLTTLRHNLPLSAFWTLRREATLNWLALGLLLAAWNASDNNAPDKEGAAGMHRRPEALRGYSYVSVRAANRVTQINR